MFPVATAVPPAVGIGEFSVLLFVLIAVVVPVAAFAFARSGRGLAELGRGPFSVDFDNSTDDSREDELRQMVEARAFRRQARGEDPGDTEAEIEQVLGLDPGDTALPGEACPAGRPQEPSPKGPEDREDDLREEVRQVVLARNESRLRRGESELDVEAEIERLLGETG